jgi:hypothetical protein
MLPWKKEKKSKSGSGTPAAAGQDVLATPGVPMQQHPMMMQQPGYVQQSQQQQPQQYFSNGGHYGGGGGGMMMGVPHPVMMVSSSVPSPPPAQQPFQAPMMMYAPAGTAPPVREGKGGKRSRSNGKAEKHAAPAAAAAAVGGAPPAPTTPKSEKEAKARGGFGAFVHDKLHLGHHGDDKKASKGSKQRTPKDGDALTPVPSPVPVPAIPHTAGTVDPAFFINGPFDAASAATAAAHAGMGPARAVYPVQAPQQSMPSLSPGGMPSRDAPMWDPAMPPLAPGARLIGVSEFTMSNNASPAVGGGFAAPPPTPAPAPHFAGAGGPGGMMMSFGDPVSHIPPPLPAPVSTVTMQPDGTRLTRTVSYEHTAASAAPPMMTTSQMPVQQANNGGMFSAGPTSLSPFVGSGFVPPPPSATSAFNPALHSPAPPAPPPSAAIASLSPGGFANGSIAPSLPALGANGLPLDTSGDAALAATLARLNPDTVTFGSHAAPAASAAEMSSNPPAFDNYQGAPLSSSAFPLPDRSADYNSMSLNSSHGGGGDTETAEKLRKLLAEQLAAHSAAQKEQQELHERQRRLLCEQEALQVELAQRQRDEAAAARNNAAASGGAVAPVVIAPVPAPPVMQGGLPPPPAPAVSRAPLATVMTTAVSASFESSRSNVSALGFSDASSTQAYLSQRPRSQMVDTRDSEEITVVAFYTAKTPLRAAAAANFPAAVAAAAAPAAAALATLEPARVGNSAGPAAPLPAAGNRTPGGGHILDELFGGGDATPATPPPQAMAANTGPYPALSSKIVAKIFGTSPTNMPSPSAVSPSTAVTDDVRTPAPDPFRELVPVFVGKPQRPKEGTLTFID